MIVTGGAITAFFSDPIEKPVKTPEIQKVLTDSLLSFGTSATAVLTLLTGLIVPIMFTIAGSKLKKQRLNPKEPFFCKRLLTYGE